MADNVDSNQALLDGPASTVELRTSHKLSRLLAAVTQPTRPSA